MSDLGLVPLEPMHFLFLLPLSCFSKNLSKGLSDPSIDSSTLLVSIMSHVNKIDGKIWDSEKRQILPWIVFIYSFVQVSNPAIQQIHIQYLTMGLLLWTLYSSGKEEWNRQSLTSFILSLGNFLKPIAVSGACNCLGRNRGHNWVFAGGLIMGVRVQDKRSFTIWTVILLLKAARVVAISRGEE